MLPFNGVKNSGLGFLQSEDAYLNLVDHKATMAQSEMLTRDTWMLYHSQSVTMMRSMSIIAMMFSTS